METQQANGNGKKFPNPQELKRQVGLVFINWMMFSYKTS
jgi:hypothetical protein